MLNLETVATRKWITDNSLKSSAQCAGTAKKPKKHKGTDKNQLCFAAEHHIGVPSPQSLGEVLVEDRSVESGQGGSFLLGWTK